MQLRPFAFALMLTAGLCAAGSHSSHAQTTAPTQPPANSTAVASTMADMGVTQTTTTTANGVTRTATKTADGRTQTTVTTATGTTITWSGLPTSSEMIIINGVKYECPLGSVLTTGADGKAVIMPPSGVSKNRSVPAGRNSIRGTNNTIIGMNNVISGNDNRVSGGSDTISGIENNVTGSSDTLSGNKSTIKGSSNTVWGSGNTVSGNSNTLYGDNDSVSGSNDTLNSSRSIITGSNKTIYKPQAAPPIVTVPLVAGTSPQTVNVNTVNGVEYRSPTGSLLRVDTDGTAHITFE